MQPQQPVSGETARLRFVFSDALVYLSLPPDATFGDVALRWSDLAPQRRDVPIAVDIVMPMAPGTRAASCSFGAGQPLA